MQKYGYLGGDPASGYEAQYAENSIVEAIINIQKFGGIEQTGVFDENTKEVRFFEVFFFLKILYNVCRIAVDEKTKMRSQRCHI